MVRGSGGRNRTYAVVHCTNGVGEETPGPSPAIDTLPARVPRYAIYLDWEQQNQNCGCKTFVKIFLRNLLELLLEILCKLYWPRGPRLHDMSLEEPC